MSLELSESLEICTKRLLIIPFSERHLTPRYVEWLNDPEIVRFSEQRHKKHTIESCHRYMKSFEGTPNYFFAIEEIETGIGHIGNINAYVDKNNSLADIGILLGEKQAQSKGYGLEAWLGVCDFLFHEVGIRKITAGTISLNTPMLKLMRRAEMIDDGVRREHYIFKDKLVDVIHMALFREQFAGIANSSQHDPISG
ncbi:MAG: GNAT family N-acetyltransferase [Deltaproteobacteria bacterium]|nr:GNAT family N-acetyltransferase [Deltaproteobacteria bacterium]